MILYNVTINIDDDEHDSWLDWMKHVHIPDVLNTGLFIESKICRIHAEEEGGKAYSVQYLLNSWEDYEIYKSKYALKLQNDHARNFKGKFVAFRTILEVIHEDKC